MIPITDALDDEHLFGPWFAGPSWSTWKAVLKGAFCLPMDAAELKLFRAVAERDPPKRRVRELWAIVGRRGGKDSVASAIACYAAGFVDYRQRPASRRAGERSVPGGRQGAGRASSSGTRGAISRHRAVALAGEAGDGGRGRADDRGRA